MKKNPFEEARLCQALEEAAVQLFKLGWHRNDIVKLVLDELTKTEDAEIHSQWGATTL